MKQIQVNNNIFIPMPVTLIGCQYKGKANFMAAGWVSRVNANPPWIGIGIHHSHATAEGIIEQKCFSVCFPGLDQIVQTDYCGIVSGKKVDKSSLFSLFYGDLKTAPMIEEASLNLECTLVQTIDGPTNYFFIGEIKGAYASPKCLEDGKLDPLKSDFLMLTMPDNTYWSLGEPVGEAWHIGKRLIP